MAGEVIPMKEQNRHLVAPAQGAVLRQHQKLRALLRTGLTQLHATMTGQVLTHKPLRSLAVTVRDGLLEHVAELETLAVPTREEDPPFGPSRASWAREKYAEELAELETLSAWPEEKDDLELGRRFERLGQIVLERIAREERDEVFQDIIRNDFAVDDPFGC